jgi:hypothetical protein
MRPQGTASCWRDLIGNIVLFEEVRVRSRIRQAARGLSLLRESVLLRVSPAIPCNCEINQAPGSSVSKLFGGLYWKIVLCVEMKRRRRGDSTWKLLPSRAASIRRSHNSKFSFVDKTTLNETMTVGAVTEKLGGRTPE